MKHGFTELPHTADWAVRVTAGDLPGLFAEAAAGMYALAGTRVASGPRVSETFESVAPDPESLLVRFLSELLFDAEHEGLAFDRFEVETEQHTDSYTLRVKMEGAPITEQAKAIKAVTFHNLEIQSQDDGLQVEIVFDV